VTGAKVHRHESSGLQSLTPSERRIVDLAGGGASNPEIAQALFVTVKTVEMHLGHAYRKLGIRSRRELAGLISA
jgi:DNA-binding CsgD family transcriptional regulator